MVEETYMKTANFTDDQHYCQHQTEPLLSGTRWPPLTEMVIGIDTPSGLCGWGLMYRISYLNTLYVFFTSVFICFLVIYYTNVCILWCRLYDNVK